MMELLWLLLPVAAASGWWIARRGQVACNNASVRSTEYLKGLNYLIDDKPDEAIEIFTRMADVDQDTVEMHLILGNLFRRRGEVDRAIHIHSSLIKRNHLTVKQRHQAMLELGEDYLRAGLLDRAEVLFLELMDQSKHTEVALSRLVYIFQQEKDWQQAIMYCDRLEQISGISRRREIAHYRCELAEESIQQQEPANARKWLQEALVRDPCCVRASMLLGYLFMDMGHYQEAIAAFQAVEQQDLDYFPEVINALSQCYSLLGNLDEWIAYLRKVHERDHGGRFTDALAEWLLKQEGEEAALDFLERELNNYPTLLGLRRLVEIKLEQSKGAEYADLRTLHCISTQMLNSTARYRCDNCGFVTRSLLWCCPSCLRWNTIKPLPDLVMKTGA
ncbi:MAG: lipopolysaccharide assembly protein LapB [Candidatus Contendobacter odensis]|uniref:Lipopolysaccharide assembly protein B n=1 Tax=Candidatus Contendibacter odensensis TaxID=1400860 RepID=A0A2G6PGD2_9GAMM|nr:MAG: lipopolysaccharide assembly protein LapB [Candidatus Contendobacter odensis]